MGFAVEMSESNYPSDSSLKISLDTIGTANMKFLGNLSFYKYHFNAYHLIITSVLSCVFCYLSLVIF